MSRSSAFKHKPIPWMYSRLGSMFASALIKLSPVHRQLTQLEIKNIRDYFDSDFVAPEQRRQISGLTAFFMTYFHAIGRLTSISRLARQDYYALQRQGCFAVPELPVVEQPLNPTSTQEPLLIVPGLNTPTAFFREMYDYFTGRGYNVRVMPLPNNGFSDIETSANCLDTEVEAFKAQCHASKINVIGHCMGGLIAYYWLEKIASKSCQAGVKNIVSLGSGFLGAEGVSQLKQLWIPRNAGKPVPPIFDELIHWNRNYVSRSSAVAYHSLLTIWDFMVHFRKGLLQATSDMPCHINNLIMDDPAIDHLTLVLNHRVFRKIEQVLQPC